MPEFLHPAWLALLALLPAAVVLRHLRGPAESRFRRLAGTTARCLGLAALVTALAGPLALAWSQHTDVIYALDRSSSVSSEASAQALDFINRAMAARHPDARVGVVVFGADAAVESLPRRNPEPLRTIASHVERGATDIARAIEVAIGAFDGSEHRRVVLLSDGRQNLGDARAAAAVARSVGIEVSTVALAEPPARAEVSVRGINAPSHVRVHEPFRVRVTVHSRRKARAHLVLLRNGSLAHERRLKLEAGANTVVFLEQSSRGGLHEYEALVNTDLDGETENNRYQAFVQVDGAPRVLLAQGHGRGDDPRNAVPDGQPGEANGGNGQVSAALEAQGFQVERVPASAIPATMHGLSDYDLVILDNVSGFDLSLSKMELLESYVRDAGGGLIKLGGDSSYAAGGYYGTPVERLLPVSMDVKTSVKIPSLAVIFVLDRSGSMGSRSRGEEKITIAKNAALSSIDLLNPLDRIGVLAFDDDQEWIVAPTEVGNRRPIARRLASLSAGGSTDLFRALDEAVRVMSEQQAKVRHLIVLSDGLTGRDANFSLFAERIARENITVSTVALGLDADQALMAELARTGNGRFYFTDDPRNVPRIFTSETMLVARNLVVERDTQPMLTYPGEMVAGFDADAFPVLAGYQRAFAKPAAQVILSAPDQDPLLAVWRYGLGKSVAFTSDLSGRWSPAWLRWDQFSRFVGQMARWSMRRTGNETLHPSFRQAGQRGEVEVDVLDGDERFINELDLVATVYRPDRSTEELRLEQVAPGRYSASFAVPGAGRYYVNLSGARDTLRVGPKTFGLAVPYSSEYRDLGADLALLEDVAAATGGALLPMSAAALPAILAPASRSGAGRFRVWWPLLSLALALLVLETAVRKLVVPDAWLAPLRQRLAADETAEPEREYEALRETIAAVRDRHLQALREGGHYATEDAAVRARLYRRRAGSGKS